jgi:hypothetical protein
VPSDKQGCMYASDSVQTLFAIEGTGQTGLGANFGDGYATSSAASSAAANPNPFFQALLTKPYRGMRLGAVSPSWLQTLTAMLQCVACSGMPTCSPT